MSTDTIPFYNTTGLTGSDLQEAEKCSITQSEIILAQFRLHPTSEYSPSDIHTLLFPNDTPLTSIRRSITSLTKAGHLVKNPTRLKIGNYGKSEHVWSLNKSQNLK
jgi:hypothetical protein